MSLRALVTTSPQSALRGGQMSHANRVAPVRHGRAPCVARALRLPPLVSAYDARVFWADLVRRRCGTREACAAMFGVTFQTACNWFDGFTVPTGDKVMTAQRAWPEDFRADFHAKGRAK